MRQSVIPAPFEFRETVRGDVVAGSGFGFDRPRARIEDGQMIYIESGLGLVLSISHHSRISENELFLHADVERWADAAEYDDMATLEKLLSPAQLAVLRRHETDRFHPAELIVAGRGAADDFLRHWLQRHQRLPIDILARVFSVRPAFMGQACG